MCVPISWSSRMAQTCESGAGPGRSVLHALLVGFRVGDELGQRADRKVLARDQDARGIRDQRHRLEIGHRVVRRLFVEGRDLAEYGEAGEQQRIAVGRRLGDPVRTGHAAGAADILDDELLMQQLAHARCEDSRLRVVRAARGIGHHESHRPHRPILGVTGADGAEGRRDGNREGKRECSHPRMLPSRPRFTGDCGLRCALL